MLLFLDNRCSTRSRMKKIEHKKLIQYVWVLAILLVVISFSLVGTRAYATGQVTEMSGKGTITTDSLNVRSGPGKEYDSIGKLYPSDTIKITGTDGNWYRIDYNGSQGYVSSDYVLMENVDDKEEVSQESTSTDIMGEGYVEGNSVFDIYQYKIPIIIGSIIVVFIIIFITLRGIRKLDEDDDEDDEEDEEDDDYDEDEYDEDEYDDEEDEEEPFVRQKRSGNNQEIYNLRDEPKTKNHAGNRSNKEINMILSNNSDDYRIDIDPIFFEDDKKKESKKSNKNEDLRKAMEKMEELQREIERIKKQDK